MTGVGWGGGVGVVYRTASAFHLNGSGVVADLPQNKHFDALCMFDHVNISAAHFRSYPIVDANAFHRLRVAVVSVCAYGRAARLIVLR